MQNLDPLVGNWKLVSLQMVVDGAAAPPDLFGLNPRGYLILTREGRMALIITGENRKGGMSDPERAQLHKSMFAVSGKYRIEGSDLLIAVDVSWNEAWNGTELKALSGWKATSSLSRQHRHRARCSPARRAWASSYSSARSSGRTSASCTDQWRWRAGW